MLTTLPPSCAVVMKSGNLNFLEPSGPLQACNGTALPLLTPWSSVLLQKPTDSQLVKKFPTFYVTGKFITAFTSARHLSLSCVSSIQSMPPTSHFLKIHLNISHLLLVSQVVFYTQVSPPKPRIRISSPPYALHTLPHFITRTILGEFRSLSSSLLIINNY